MLLTIGILALLIGVSNFTAAESISPEINEQTKAAVNDGTYISATIKSDGDTKLSGDAYCFFANPIRKFINPNGKWFTILGNAETYTNIFEKIFGNIFGPEDPIGGYIELEILSGSSLNIKPILGAPITLESGKIKFTKFVGFVQFRSTTAGDGMLTYISGRIYGVTIDEQ
jgi:hypothetical protein